MISARRLLEWGDLEERRRAVLGLLGPDPEPKQRPGQWFDDYLREAAARYRPASTMRSGAASS